MLRFILSIPNLLRIAPSLLKASVPAEMTIRFCPLVYSRGTPCCFTYTKMLSHLPKVSQLIMVMDFSDIF